MLGVFKENDIHGNSNAGVAARGSARGLFKDNKVHDGKQVPPQLAHLAPQQVDASVSRAAFGSRRRPVASWWAMTSSRTRNPAYRHAVQLLS